MTWHQFRATRGEPLGFLCMVNATRDKPQLPSAEDLAQLQSDQAVAAFLRNEPERVEGNPGARRRYVLQAANVFSAAWASALDL